MPLSTQSLLEIVADEVEEVVKAIHDSVMKNRAADAADWAMTLSSTTGAYRDLVMSLKDEE